MTDLWIADLWPRARTSIISAPHDHQSYGEGEEVPLRLATALVVAQGGVLYEPHLLSFAAEKSGLGLSQGYPRVEWPAEPAAAKIQLDNAGGCLNWWRHLSFDGARVRIRRLPQTSGRVSEILEEAETHFDGIALGTPRGGDRVELALRGSFAVALGKAAQRRTFLGSGNRLDFGGQVLGQGQTEVDGLAGALTVVALAAQGPDHNWGFVWRVDGGSRLVRAVNGAYTFKADSISLSTPVVPFWQPRWLAWSFDGSAVDFYWSRADGSGFERLGGGAASRLVEESFGILTLGSVGGFHLQGSIAELRVYDRGLTASEIAPTLGRPLRLDDPADLVGLVHHYPMNEGAGLLAHDVIGERHLELSGDASWGSTGEGGLELRDQPMPAVLPGRAIVPLTRVSTLESGNVARAHHGPAEYLAVWSPSLVRLAPAEWEPYPAAEPWGVRLLTGGDGTFIAEVEVAGDATVRGHARSLLEQMGPALEPAEIEDEGLGDLGAMASSFYLGEPMTTYEALRRLLEPLGGVIELGEALTLRRFGADFRGSIPASIVREAEEVPLTAPPASLVVGYAPVYASLEAGAEVPASDPDLAPRTRAGRLTTPPMSLDDLEAQLWPSAVPAPRLETSLVSLADALAVRGEAWDLARERLIAVSIQDGAETFELGDSFFLFAGDPETAWECQTGLEIGPRAIVAQVELSTTEAPRVVFLVQAPKILGPPS